MPPGTRPHRLPLCAREAGGARCFFRQARFFSFFFLDAPQESAEKKPERKNDFDNRRKLMYVLCGGYLIYLAIKMGRDYPGLAASGVWSSDRIIALCGAIAFSIIGAALLVITAVRSVREWKQDAQNEQEEHTDE